MAVPIIDPILFLDLTEDVAMTPVTPRASESPTSWSASGLPAGLSCDSGSGKIHGTPTTAGYSAASITATNGSGASQAMKFYIGVSAAPVAEEGLVEIEIDWQTGLARNSSITDGSPIVFGRNGDKVPLAIGFVRDAALRKLDVTNIKVVLRDDYEKSEAVVAFDDAPGAPLDIIRPRYRVMLDLTAAAVLATIGEHDKDSAIGGSDFQCKVLCEVEVTYNVTSIGGATEAIRSSANFHVHLARHLEG